MATRGATPAGADVRHPAGLRTLFFTELWERFSYYGMRALLVLYMVDGSRGMGLDDKTATAIYGLYTAAVFVVALPGGWIADRLLGARRAIWYGGILIAAGHFTLALPWHRSFFAGLLLIILGTGLLKPNISAVVGALYGEHDPRRDAGFTWFYMAINIGAFAGATVCGWLGESQRFGWHYGFAAAGVGMVVGLIYFRFTAARLGTAGAAPAAGLAVAEIRAGWRYVVLGVGGLLLLAGLMMANVIAVNALALAQGSAIAIAALAVAFFLYVFMAGKLSVVERRHVAALVILILASAVFFSGFEQAGSSLNLFAARYTDRVVGGFVVPASWFQNLNPGFLLILAPLFASLWTQLGRRNRAPSTATKFALGLVLLGLGFLVMIGATRGLTSGAVVSPDWLVMTYLLHTMGELALSPVGLSATTRLAPTRFAGQMMGMWFVGLSLGNLLAGLMAGEFRDDAIADMPGLYARIVLLTVGGGLLLLLCVRPMRRLMSDVE